MALSCGKLEETPTSAPASAVITFGAEIGRDNSRAVSLVGSETEMRTKPFCVFGDWKRDAGYSETVFKQVNVTYNEAFSGWNYSPTKHWEDSGDYEFRAYWPASTPIANTSNTSALALEYNMLTQDEDLMVAYKSCQTKESTVDLSFRHALSAVAVKFETTDDTREYWIKRVYFTGLYYTGTLLYSATDNTLDLTNAWLHAKRSDVDVNGITTMHLREWSSDTGQKIPRQSNDYQADFNLFIPQSLQVDEGVAKPSISITVDVKLEDITTEITFSVELPSTDDEGNPWVWQAGKKYVYVIGGPPADYSISVSITDWDKVNASVGDIEF